MFAHVTPVSIHMHIINLYHLLQLIFHFVYKICSIFSRFRCLVSLSHMLNVSPHHSFRGFQLISLFVHQYFPTDCHFRPSILATTSVTLVIILTKSYYPFPACVVTYLFELHTFLRTLVHISETSDNTGNSLNICTSVQF